MRAMSFALVLLTALCPSTAAADDDPNVQLLRQSIGADGRAVFAKTVSAKGAGAGNFLVEPVNGPDGKPTAENIWAEDVLVDVMPPDTFDRDRRLRIYRGENNVIAVALYGDKANNKLRANGYILDAPIDANVVKVVREGDKSRIVWQDRTGAYLSAVVPRLPNRPNLPADGQKNAPTEPVTDEMRQQLGLPEPTINPNAANTTGGTNTAAPTTGANPTAATGTGTDGTATAQGGAATAVVDVPPIKEPGNPYGIDPILSPDEVKAAAAEAFGKVRGEAKDGMAMDDYGVGTGGKSKIQHLGGIDGCLDATHAQLKFFPAVLSHVQQVAKEKRTKLETERNEAIRKNQEAAAAAAAAQTNTNTATPPPATTNTPTAGPVATSTDRPAEPAAPSAPSAPTNTVPTMPDAPQAPPATGGGTDFAPDEFSK